MSSDLDLTYECRQVVLGMALSNLERSIIGVSFYLSFCIST